MSHCAPSDANDNKNDMQSLLSPSTNCQALSLSVAGTCVFLGASNRKLMSTCFAC